MNIEINNEVLVKEINSLSNLITTYEELYTKIFNEFNEISIFWKDNTANEFFKKLEYEKLNFNKEQIKMKNELEVYKYIYNSYKEIGNDILCNLNSKKYIIDKLNKIKEKLENILIEYNDLNTSICIEAEEYLKNEKEKIKEILDTTKLTKNTIENTFKEIEKVEQEVNNKLNKLEKLEQKEFDNSKYINE
jgi:hypothetical protein